MANINTSARETELQSALAAIEAKFRDRLVKTYLAIRDAYSEQRADLCALRAAKFSEILIRYLQQKATGSHASFGSRLGNFADECRRLEQVSARSLHESYRILIPRALLFLYTIRNKREVGHVGGDVDANLIDAATCLRVADWCMSELIRLEHGLSLEEAQGLLDAIAVRQLPEIWEVGGKRRVLDINLDFKGQVLLLLYRETAIAVAVEDLFAWTEHSRKDHFKTRVLRPLHRQRMIEYDEETQTASLSPKGAREVEETILGVH